ncbi:hypothetical protein BH24ACT5_BH24ACT5_12700 [soil metagenome]
MSDAAASAWRAAPIPTSRAARSRPRLTEYQHRRVGSRLEEHLGGMALDHALFDRVNAGAQLPDRLVDLVGRGRAQPEPVHVQTAPQGEQRQREREVPGAQRHNRDAAALGILDGPVECALRRVGPVDPDDPTIRNGIDGGLSHAVTTT